MATHGGRSGLLCTIAIAVAIGGGAPAAAQEILDLDRVAMLAPAGRAAYRAFLADEFHRAFALADGGAWGWRSGKATVEDASAEALAHCAERATEPCRIL